MVLIEVRCPICSARGRIEVSEERIKKVSRGVLAVNVAPKIVCEHSFVAYIDKNLAVRDCFVADFQITVPDKQTVEEEDRDLINLDILKMNLTVPTIIYSLRGILLKKKVVIISDKDFLFNHINNFFKYITQDTFDTDISIISLVDYMKAKKKYKDYLVVGRNEVLKDKEQILPKDYKKLKVENRIVDKFFTETDFTSSMIILKNEVKKIYEYSKAISDFVNNSNKGKITSKDLIDLLAKTHNTKIQMPYLEFLVEIVEHYFGIKVPLDSDITDFLGFL